MSIDEIIYDILIANSAVTGLVGAKIYSSQAPQGTQFPFVCFEVVSNMPTNTKTGPSKLDFYRVQVTALSQLNPNANAIKEAIRTALDYYQDSQVQNIFFLNENSSFQGTSGQDGVYLKYQDFLISLTK